MATTGKVWNAPALRDSSLANTDHAAEREMVALIMRSVDDGLHRKGKILETLEKLENPMVQEREDVQEQIAWLMATLDETNVALKRSFYYMRELYGAFYRTEHPTASRSKQEIVPWFLPAHGLKKNETKENTKQLRHRRPVINPSQSDLDEWSSRLILDTEDICHNFLCEILALDGDPGFTIDCTTFVGALLLVSSLMEKHLHEFVNVHGLEAILYTQKFLFDEIESPTTRNEQTVTALLSSAQSDSQEGLVRSYAEAVADERTALIELEEAVHAWSAEISSLAILQEA